MTPKDLSSNCDRGRRASGNQTKLHKHRIEKVLVVDEDFRLKGLVTVKDMMKAESHPNAAKDAAATIGCGGLEPVLKEKIESVLW